MAPTDADAIAQKFFKTYGILLKIEFVYTVLKSAPTDNSADQLHSAIAQLSNLRVALSDESQGRLSATDNSENCQSYSTGIEIGNGDSGTFTGSYLLTINEAIEIGYSQEWQSFKRETSKNNVKTTESIKAADRAGTDCDELDSDCSDSLESSNNSWHKMCRLILSDIDGNEFYAIEMRKIDQISSNLQKGTKIILRNPVFQLGVLFLYPETTTIF